jgi:hypothetical protein
MGIGLGVGINRSNYAQGIFGAYATRVVADGGVVEGGACVDAVSSLLQSASLLLVPSGYKGGKLYAEIPTNGNGDLTWTRGSDAFRTNASGLIQRVPWNLLSYSEEFSNAYWNKITSTISANTTTAPNGTLTADTLSVTTSTYSGLGRAITGVSANYNVSIYAKKNTKNWLYLIDVLGTGARAWFDLDNGVLGTVASGYTATITNVGDGWYRCTLSNNTAQVLAYYQLGLADANNGITPTSSGSAFIWGAQLVEGTTAQTYLPTTDRLNFPRLSYMYGSCPSVLLEPQRTNLVLQSNTFNTTWSLFGGATITSNSTTSPDGSTNATTLNSAGGGNDFLYQSFTVTNAITYTVSFYIKNVNSTQSKFYIPIAAFPEAVINWSGSTLTSITSSGTNSFTAMSNGWYRVAVTATATATGTYIFRIYSDNNNTSKSIYIYGTQLEAGAYPTTYISTTSATATRVADSFSRNNIYTNGLITASGGTWFVEFRNNIAYRGDSAGDGIFLRTIGDTDNFRFYSDNTATSRIIIFKRVSNVNSQIYTTTADTVKIAIKWNGSTADIFANGTKVVSATSFTATQLQEFTTSITAVPKFIQQMALYPEPKSDQFCIDLTTL